MRGAKARADTHSCHQRWFGNALGVRSGEDPEGAPV